MKYFKLYEEYTEDEYGVDIPKTTIDGIYYHGGIIQDGEFFNKLSTNYSDWEALWFCDDINISKEFSENWSDEDSINVIFKVNLKSDEIASIDLELFNELIEFYMKDDLREVIPFLVEEGFDGWETLGSIGSTQYEDIALFDDSIIEYLGMSFKIGNTWSEFIEMSETEEYFNKLNN